ncbi:MAG: signal peptide peptidase SppA [Alphaproteobacteria bacterium]
MNLEADMIVHSRRLRRRLIFWRTLAVVVLIAMAVGIAQQIRSPDLGAVGRPYVARISVSGLIVEDRDLLDRIEAIRKDGRVRALMVHIDSPGGTVVGGESLYEALRAVAADKPVVAVMGTTAASAGYMVAIGADRIVARAGTVTGSIGVLLQTAQVTDMLESIGVRPISIKSSPLKAAPSPLEELTPAGRDAAQEVVDAMYRLFVDMVAERRGLSGERLDAVTDGRIFTGRQAQGLGLVDDVGGEEQARTWLDAEKGVADSLPVIDMDPRRDFSLLGRLTSMVFGKSLFTERLILDGLISVWHPDLRS